MKKLKFPLTALAILAIVGTALGFRAKAFSAPTVFCVAAGTTEGECPGTGSVQYIQDDSGTVTNPCASIPNTTPHITIHVAQHVFCSTSGSSAYSAND